VIACFLAAAHIPVDARTHEAARDRRVEQQMIDA